MSKIVWCCFRYCQGLKPETFRIEGSLKTWKRYSESGSRHVAHFCADCGNRIYPINLDKPDLIKLKPGALSNRSVIQPIVHVWTREKQDWVSIQTISSSMKPSLFIGRVDTVNANVSRLKVSQPGFYSGMPSIE